MFLEISKYEVFSCFFKLLVKHRNIFLMYDQLVQLLLVMSTVYGLAYLIFTNARHASRYCYLILTNLSFKYYGGFFFFYHIEISCLLFFAT